jgi:tetratricopeptide (TPR) repeat protein
LGSATGSSSPKVAAGGSRGERHGTARARAALHGIAGCLLLALAGLTWRQTGIYRDSETLWRDTLAKNPGAWMAHTNLGAVLYARGEYEAALAHAREAARLKPDYEVAHYNSANALLALGRFEEAVSAFRRALELRPVYPDAHSNLAVALSALGRNQEALESLSLALAARPDRASTHYNRGAVQERLGRRDLAARDYRRALELDPALSVARESLRRVTGIAGAP